MPRVEAPRFPDRTVNLKEFNAVGNGETLCTSAFADAINALSEQGGGHLVVPAGVWLTGPIVLKVILTCIWKRGCYPFLS